MSKFKLSALLSFSKQTTDDKEKGDKCASSVSHVSKRAPWSQEMRNPFKKFADRLIAEAKAEGRASSAENYATAVTSFLKFLDEPDIPVAKIGKSLLKSYEQWLWGNGVSHNASSCYMRSLRAIYNKAVKKYHLQNHYPFEAVFTGNDKIEQRVMGKSDMAAIEALDLEPGSDLERARDLFLFQFYAACMPFWYAANLKKEFLHDDYIYSPHKLSKGLIYIEILPPMQKIIERYDDPASKYVFPRLKAVLDKKPSKEYDEFFAHYHQQLDQIGEMAGVGKTLKAYLAKYAYMDDF
jgi:integrase/recombinase XerD